MIATHKYSPPKTAVSRSRTHLRVYATSTSYTYATAFSARLNGLQVDQVDRENDKRTSTYTQLVLSRAGAHGGAGGAFAPPLFEEEKV